MPDKIKITAHTVESKEGELHFLSGDKGDEGSPSLPLHSEVPREVLLEYFARLLVHCALHLYEEQHSYESSSLLQGINKRTG